ncbi:MAG: tyrosine--tRNA ligase [Alphaproteobacteria bacterium]|nr:MAG: tyrosine--tRNA ligase [Alphaproteobacteria bacterium]
MTDGKVLHRAGVLDELRWRGFVHQTTSEELGGVLDAGPIALYIGFDPTAASLHVGHLVQLMALRHFQRYGHQVIGLVGGGTGMIGDPSGKSEERNLQTIEKIADNGQAIQRQVSQVLDAPENPPIYANNYDWLGKLSLIEFLRDTGKHFSVNAMIQKDSVRNRIERDDVGISFTEFSYMLLQARDYLELFRRHGCTLQCGGSDQWGNIVSGTDLIRRVEGGRAFGLTFNLLVKADGQKFGKTEKGSVFLAAELTSPFAFYQFWVNAADDDVGRYLRLFSFRPRAEIEALEATVGQPERAAQKALAYDVTALVHGPAAADQAIKASDVLFSGDIAGLSAASLEEIFADVPSIAQSFDGAGVPLVDALVATGLCASKGEARRQIEQGAIRVNGEVVARDQVARVLTAAELIDGTVAVLKRGKRNTALVRRG